MENKFKINFIGIGAPKSGTTWLSHALDAHPEICFSSMKETSFFCGKNPLVHNALLRYDGKNISQYPLFFKHCGQDKERGEFSVHYMYDPTVAGKIYKNFPQVKIIAVLRNPVSRFISDYRYRRYMRKEEKRPIEDLLSSNGFLVQYGMYAKQLEKYFALFPKENIKILIFEEMIKNPSKALKEIYSFIGVDDSFMPRALLKKKINVTQRVRFRFITKFMHQIRLLMIRLGMESVVNRLMKAGIEKYMLKINSQELDYENIDDETKRKIKQFYMGDIKKLEKTFKQRPFFVMVILLSSSPVYPGHGVLIFYHSLIYYE